MANNRRLQQALKNKSFQNQALANLLRPSRSSDETMQKLNESVVNHQLNSIASNMPKSSFGAALSAMGAVGQAEFNNYRFGPQSYGGINFGFTGNSSRMMGSLSGFIPNSSIQGAASTFGMNSSAAMSAFKRASSQGQSDAFRMQGVQDFNQVASYATEAQRDRVAKFQEAQDLKRFRNRARQAETLPLEQSLAEMRQIRQDAAGRFTDRRFYTDIERKIPRLQEQVNLSSARSGIRDILSGTDSPSGKIDQLKDLAGRSEGVKVQKEILTEIRKQTTVIEKDTAQRARAFESAQASNPLLAKMMFGGGGGEPPSQADLARFDRYNNRITVAKSLGSGIASGLGIANEFMRSGVMSEQNIFSNISSVQATNAQNYLRAQRDMSGQGLLRKYGDILLGSATRDRRYLGETGQITAIADSQRQLEAIKAQERRDAWKSLGGAALSVGAGIAGIATGVGSIPGAALLASGVAGLYSSATSLFGNRQFKAGIGGVRGQEAESSYLAQQRDIVESRREADLQRNAIWGQSLDDAFSYRETARQGVLALGSRSYSSNRNLERRGMSYIGYDEPGETARQNQSRLRRDLLSGTIGGPVSEFGITSSELDAMTNQAALSMGAGYTGGRGRDVASQFLRLERSGRGSMEQLMGNLQALNRVSGQANSSKELERIMSTAVGQGFDNSRLAQQFVQGATNFAASQGVTDVAGLASKLGGLTGLFGGGERGFQLAQKSLTDRDRFIGSNTLAQRLGEAQNFATYGALQAAGISGASASAFADRYAGLNTAKKEQFIKELKTGKFTDPEFEFIAANLSGLDKGAFLRNNKVGLPEFLRSQQINQQFGGQSDAANAAVQRVIQEFSVNGKLSVSGKDKARFRNRLNEEVQRDTLALTGSSFEQVQQAVYSILPEEAQRIYGRAGAAVDKKALAEYNRNNTLGFMKAASAEASAIRGLGTLGTSLFGEAGSGSSIAAGMGVGKNTALAALLEGGSDFGTGLGSKRLNQLYQGDSGKMIAKAVARIMSLRKDNKDVSFKSVSEGAGLKNLSEEAFQAAVPLTMNKEQSMMFEDMNRVNTNSILGIQTVSMTTDTIKALGEEIGLRVTGRTDSNLKKFGDSKAANE